MSILHDFVDAVNGEIKKAEAKAEDDEVGRRLSLVDKPYIKRITDYLEKKDKSDELTSEDIGFLLSIFTERWTAISNKPDLDYTFNWEGINARWVQLAKQLEEHMQHLVPPKSALQILIPTVDSLSDPNAIRPVAVKDLPNLILGERDRFFCSLKEFISKDPVFTYHHSLLSPKDSKDPLPPSSALTLRMLWRIKQKKLAHDYGAMRNQPSTYWGYLKKEVVPTWSKIGLVPRQLKILLLELATVYFEKDEISSSKFKVLFVSFAQQLLNYSVNDVNCLYGQVIIQAEPASVYLVDILLALYEDPTPSCKINMEAVARWICETDPSLISESTDLSAIYQSLSVGRYFDSESLSTKLRSLPSRSEDSWQSQKELVINLLKNKQKIDAEVISEFNKLCEIRWLKIMGTEVDFFSARKGENSIWIDIVRRLKGANYLGDTTIVQTLMPGILTDKDMITGESIDNLSLGRCILAESRTYIISLENSARIFEKTHEFLNVNVNPRSPFTKLERERLKRAAAQYQKFLSIEPTPCKASIPLAFLKDLYQLAMIYLSGNEEERDSKTVELIDKLHVFSSNERDAILSVKINYLQYSDTLNDLFLARELKCKQTQGLLLAKLVTNYLPYIYFPSADPVNANLINEMQRNSEKLLCKEYADVSSDVAKLKLQKIVISLFTSQFPTERKRTKVNWGAHTTFLPTSLLSLFNFVKRILEAGVDGDYIHAYLQLKEFVIPGLLEQPAISIDVSNWLSLLGSEDMFQRTAYFKVSTFLAAHRIIKVKRCPKTMHSLEEVVDEIIALALKDQINVTQEILVNLKFYEVRKNMSTQQEALLLDELRIASESKLDFIYLCKDYLLFKVGSKNAIRRASPRFWDSDSDKKSFLQSSDSLLKQSLRDSFAGFIEHLGAEVPTAESYFRNLLPDLFPIAVSSGMPR